MYTGISPSHFFRDKTSVETTLVTLVWGFSHNGRKKVATAHLHEREPSKRVKEALSVKKLTSSFLSCASGSIELGDQVRSAVSAIHRLEERCADGDVQKSSWAALAHFMPQSQVERPTSNSLFAFLLNKKCKWRQLCGVNINKVRPSSAVA